MSRKKIPPPLPATLLPADWGAFAATWLGAQGITDPAGVLVLTDLLVRYGLACGGRRPAQQDAATIAKAVTEHLSIEDVTHGTEILCATTDAALDDANGPAWMHRVAAALWTAAGPHRLVSREYPAIPERLVEIIAPILGGTARVSRTGEVLIGRKPVGSIDATRDELATMATALATTASHRLLRFVVGNAWLRALRDERFPDEVVVRGGWRGLAEQMGLSSRSAAQDLQRAGEALASMTVAMPLGADALLTAKQVRVGNDVTLTLTAVGPLKLNYVNRLRVAHKDRRLLVPLRPGLPKLTAHRQSHPHQLSFELMLLREIRLRARELRPGDVFLTPGVPHPDIVADVAPEVLASIARDAGLSSTNRETVMDTWIAPATDDGWLGRTLGGRGLYVHGSAALMEPFISAGLRLTRQGQARQLRSKKDRVQANATE